MDRMEKLERYAGMLECLSKGQLVVVALLVDGLNGDEVARLLGVSRAAVYSRLKGARVNILRAFPEVAGVVEGRSRNKGAARYGERGWGWRRSTKEHEGGGGSGGLGGDVADGGAAGMEVEW